MRWYTWGAALALAGAAPLAAQGDCFPPASSREAKVFAVLSVPLSFTGGGAPLAPGRFGVDAGLEASYLPHIDTATATPTICRPGKGPENVNILPGFLRPRIALGLPGQLVLEAAWIPPVRLNGAKANLVGLALSRIIPAGALRLALRADITIGVIHAPVTCDAGALRDPTSECFQGTLSDDTYRPNIFQTEFAAARSLSSGRLTVYGAVGYAHLAPRFQVNFTNQFGSTDRRKVEVDLDRLTLGGGGTLLIGRRTSVSGEVYSAPADAVTGRLIVRTSLNR
ncbi:MAG TPA: hypothetical protein VMG41_10500 [Gemmatimonadales bacterium]|nr:hypothetical protein [Gemmatimonadales bacterium]